MDRIELPKTAAAALDAHCDPTEGSIMKNDLFRHVLQRVKGVTTIKGFMLYPGGEPLKKKHLIEMCRRAKAETSVRRTFIATHGMLLNERNGAGLAAA